MRRTLIHVLALFAVLGLGVVVNAGSMSGTGYSFDAPQLAGATVQSFDSVAVGVYMTGVFANVTISSSTNMPYRISTDYAGNYNNPAIALENGTYDSGFTTNVLFQFANPVCAFAFNWGASDNAASLTVYSDAAGTNAIESMALPIASSSNNGEWYGLYDPSINSARIFFTVLPNNDGDWCFVDNLHYVGSVIPTPAAGWAGVALLSVMGLRRRR